MAIENMDALKDFRLREINAKSHEIVNEGLLLLDRPESPVILPMDFNNRQDYDMLDKRSDLIETWPIYLRGAKSGTFVIVQSAVDLSVILDKAFLWSLDIVAAGAIKVQQILAAGTIDEINAIIDDRKWTDFEIRS